MMLSLFPYARYRQILDSNDGQQSLTIHTRSATVAASHEIGRMRIIQLELGSEISRLSGARRQESSWNDLLVTSGLQMNAGNR